MHASRGLRSGSLLLGALAALAFPAAAGAREAWIVSETADSVAVLDIGAHTLAGLPISVGGAPVGLAIAPDGATAFVANHDDATVSVIDTRTRQQDTPIDLGGAKPTAIAMSPDGGRIYVAGLFGLRAIDTATRAPIGTPWTLHEPVPPPVPSALAVTTDGTHAYAAIDGDGMVADFDLTSFTGLEQATLTSTPRLRVANGNLPLRAIAVTPDGRKVVATGDGLGIIDTATRTVETVSSPASFTGLAITPDSGRALLVGNFSLYRFAIGTQTFESEFAMFVEPNAIAVAIDPAGTRAVVAGGTVGDYRARVFDPITHEPAGDPVALVGRPVALAIVPDQPPLATFAATSVTGPGQTVAFDASGTTDADGSVTRFDWDFGDGTVLTDGGPKPAHVYARGGTFRATLTATDDEGCGATRVFTGQTASCNGGTQAVAARDVPVPVPVAPPAPAAPPGHAATAADTARPAVTKLALRPARLGRGARTTVVSLSLTEAATVRLVVTRAVAGTRRGGRCVATARPVRGSKRCTAGASVLRRSFPARAGSNRITVTLPKRRKPGTYRVTVTAKDRAGNTSASVVRTLVVGG